MSDFESYFVAIFFNYFKSYVAVRLNSCIRCILTNSDIVKAEIPFIYLIQLP